MSSLVAAKTEPPRGSPHASPGLRAGLALSLSLELECASLRGVGRPFLRNGGFVRIERVTFCEINKLKKF